MTASTAYRLRLDEQAIRNLVAGRPVIVRVHQVPVEVVLDGVNWNRVLAAVFDMLAARIPQLDTHPLDPPEAREFLPRSKR